MAIAIGSASWMLPAAFLNLSFSRFFSPPLPCYGGEGLWGRSECIVYARMHVSKMVKAIGGGCSWLGFAARKL